jgi:tetratricopeptide (TPR) repeat protein
MQTRSTIAFIILILLISLTYSFNSLAQRNPTGKGTDDRIQNRLPNKNGTKRPGGNETVIRERPNQTQIPKIKNPDSPTVNPVQTQSPVIENQPIEGVCVLEKEIFYTIDIDVYVPYPEYTEINFKQDGIQKYEDGDYLTALEYLTIAIEEDSNDYELYYYRGLVELKIQLYEEAEEDFDKYLEYFFYSADGYFQRGLAKFYLTEKAEARKDFEIAADMGHKQAISILKRYY